jgi:hypothetical protein
LTFAALRLSMLAAGDVFVSEMEEVASLIVGEGETLGLPRRFKALHLSF